MGMIPTLEDAVEAAHRLWESSPMVVGLAVGIMAMGLYKLLSVRL